MITTRIERIQRGSTWKRRYTVRDSTGQPIDITGAFAYLTARTDTKATVASFAKTVGSGIVIDPDQVTNTGQFTVTVDAADTATLEVGDYVYDVWIKLATGEKYPVIATSRLTIFREVTAVP